MCSLHETRRILVTLASPFREPFGIGRPADRYVEVIRKLAPNDWEFLIPNRCDESELCRLVKDADGILGVGIGRKVIEAADSLRIIQVIGSGFESVDVEAAAEKGIVVCNAPQLPAQAVAEHVFALMLGLAKNIVRHDNRTRKGLWQPCPSLPLKGRTLGVVGLGSIGVEVAIRAKAFGMNVMAIKKQPSNELKESLGLRMLGSDKDLLEVLQESDIVVLSARHSEKTRGMIGQKQLQSMKKEALLINVSRGGIIDEKALIEALRNRELAGAGLDVFEKEPIEPDNPLLSLDNVLLTPHVAGAVLLSEPGWSDAVSFYVRNIQSLFSGETPENIVNAKRP